MDKVQVLLSTYNGSKYLGEQLKSILNQDYADISILIRDDGSQDNTIDLLEHYARQDSRISYYLGDNIGACKSFFDLIQKADSSAKYYAFSDQDDVWKPDKISRAVKQLLTEEGIPMLYCGNTELVDNNLEPITRKIKWPVMRPDFGNALVENICVGCTCMINRTLLEMVRQQTPEYAIMHDWWLYLTASAFGKAFYDENAYIMYRQHGNNVIGIRSNYIAEFKNRVKNFSKSKGLLTRQAQEFLKLYQLDQDSLRLIEYVISARTKRIVRWHILFSKELFRQRRLDNVIFKLLFLFGRI